MDGFRRMETEEVRTIFFNGQKGHRWVRTVVPMVEVGNHEGYPYEASCPDDRAADRRRFFGFLNALHARLERQGVSPEHVRGCYAKRFAAERPVDCSEPHGGGGSRSNQKLGQGMSACSQREWAIAAAEVQAMFQSPAVFSDRIAWLKSQPSSDSGGGEIPPKPKIASIEGDLPDPLDTVAQEGGHFGSRSSQITFKEQLQREGERCERAILRRVYAAPARIEDLDALGFPKMLVNRILYSLLHQERVTFHGFTYFYNHLRAIREKIS